MAAKLLLGWRSWPSLSMRSARSGPKALRGGRPRSSFSPILYPRAASLLYDRGSRNRKFLL